MGKHHAHFHGTGFLEPGGRHFAKKRRPYGNPVSFPAEHPRFVPPFDTNRTNLTLSLRSVVPSVSAAIEESGRMVFHVNGDTGGIHGTDLQEKIAVAMERQIDTAKDGHKPAFFYHLGDVVYFNGLTADYPTQFYEPYQYYPAPIFAIAGNHDGETQVRKGDEPDREPSLTGFKINFCADQSEYEDKYRPTMTQPYVYWTLNTPLAVIIGLYSNVDGQLDARGTEEQQRWFEQQLQEADPNKCLLVAVHHPPFSLDSFHGGYPDILVALETAIQNTKKCPDIICSGHVHNYQRFTWAVEERQVPCLIAGAGGYANDPDHLHKMQFDHRTGQAIEKEKLPFQTAEAGVRFDAYNRTGGGFLRLTVDGKSHTLTGEYFLVPFDGDPPADPIDSFTLNWKTHKLT